MLKSQTVFYQDKEVELEGYYAYDARTQGSRPVVLVLPDWSGKNTFACQKADQLARLGYIGFAVDIYGKGKIGNTKEEKMALIQPFLQDRLLLRNRLLAAYQAGLLLEEASKAIAAIGFCFGGLCVLDLAQSGVRLDGVVSFHGLLQPLSIQTYPISAKILILHGFDDPMVTPDQVMSFSQMLTQQKADWQIHMYGKTMHAFTNPEANDKDFGTLYNSLAEQRAFLAMQNFLTEIFSTRSTQNEKS